jgi:methionyl aminopeptidase
MIIIKDKCAIDKMREAGKRLASVFENIAPLIKQGLTSLDLDIEIERQLIQLELRSESKGYCGYRHVSCISFNEEVVHGVPTSKQVIKMGDIIKVDVCASWKGYCADMARFFAIGTPSKKVQKFLQVAQESLDLGIAEAREGNRLFDISATVQKHVESHGYGIVRDFAGHGIGKRMHEEPEIPNFGRAGEGPILKAGMTIAIEPMITLGDYPVFIETDGWTVKTRDKSLAAHVEDTVLITKNEPEILTRPSARVG